MTTNNEAENQASERVYYLRAETLSDATVREVVAEYDGEVLSRPSAMQWRISITPKAVEMIVARYSWNFTCAVFKS